MNKQKGSPRFTLASRSERVEAGLAPIYILLGLLIGVVILLVPIPYYRGQIVCDPPCFKDCPPCPQPGWHLGEPIWKRVIDYFVYVNKPDNVGDKMITISASPTPSTSAKTANWKTYTNAKLGYEFKYPSDWSIHNEDESGEFIIVSKQDRGSFIEFQNEKVFDLKPGQSVEEWLKSTPGFGGKYDKLDLNNEVAYIGEEGKGVEGSTEIYIKHKDKYLSIVLLGYKFEEAKSILSTFKFTE